MEKWLVCHLFIVQIHFAMENPKHLHRSPGGSFFYTRRVDNITHPKNKKKVHVSQAPETWEKLNTFHFSTCRPSTLPFLSCRWIQASMKRCASMMCMESLGSGYMGNRPSSWVCGSDEEMMGDVSFSDIFFLNSIDQTMSVQWNLLWQRLPRRPVRSSTTRSASLPLPLSAHLQRVHVPAWSGCRVSNLNPEKLRIFDACQMVIFFKVIYHGHIPTAHDDLMVIYHGRKDQKSPLTNPSIHFHEDWYCLLGEDIGRQNLSKKNGTRLSVAIRGFRGSLKMRVGLSSLEGNLWIHDLTLITTAAEVLYKPKRAKLLPSPTPFPGQLEVDPPKESRFGRRATLSEESKSSTRKRTCSASCITASMSLEVFFWSWGFNVAERSMMASERQSK